MESLQFLHLYKLQDYKDENKKLKEAIKTFLDTKIDDYTVKQHITYFKPGAVKELEDLIKS